MCRRDVAHPAEPSGGVKTMKAAALSFEDTVETVSQVSGFFRIAIPSWRRVGEVRPQIVEEPTLSREEIQSLFHGELNGKVRRKPVLTEREEEEKRLSRKLRAALYPNGGRRFSH